MCVIYRIYIYVYLYYIYVIYIFNVCFPDYFQFDMNKFFQDECDINYFLVFERL